MVDKHKQLKDNNYYYNPLLKEKSAWLRKKYTNPEKHLWQETLIARKLKGYRFMRQVSVLYYIADFMCKELALIIEIDGKNHKYLKEQDKKRDKLLKSCGFTVLRFSNKETLDETAKVQAFLEEWIDSFEKKKR
jgi:very-short-patch-repair endonuclease